MYEFHGWATIQESPSDSDAGGLHGIVERIRSEIAEMGWTVGLLQLQAANGTYFVTVGSFANRKAQEADETMRLFELIGQLAPGSYGLLYVRDDEDTNGHDNEFQVYVLARGKVTRQQDSFLSPCIPVIEDED